MFLRIKIISVIILFSFINFANAEIVKKIEISGNQRVSQETILVYGEIKINQDLKQKDLNKILKNLYSTNFFEDVKINLEKNILYITIEEYPTINQLIIIGEKSKRLKDKIIELISLKEKKSFIKSNLNNDVELIKRIYSSSGFNNSKIAIKTKNLKKNSLDLIIEIDKGKESKIRSIKFIGDKKIRDRRLRDIIASEENKFWKVLSKNSNFSTRLLNLDERLLKSYYKSLGYYDVKIVSSSATVNELGNVDIIYSIDAGKRFTITKISIAADPIFENNTFVSLNKNFKEYIGNYYSPFSIKELLVDIDEVIANKNLQFVSHDVKESIDNDLAEIQIQFTIFETEKTTIERINIIGNNVTNEDVIRGELLVDEGDPFSKLNLDKSISKIKARQIFGAVEQNVLEGSDKNLKIIEIKVEEKPTGEISAGAGVGTTGGMFAINIKENNWLGEGKNLNFNTEITSESLSGVLSYTDPNYNFLGNSISYYVGSSSNDKPDQGYENTTITAGINTSFEQYKDIFTNLGLEYSYDDLRTQGNASDSLKKQTGNFDEIMGSYGFKYDKRDRAFMPTSGSIFGFDQSIPLYADKKNLANTFIISNYKTLTEDVIGASKFYLSSINGIGGDDVRLSKRTNLGGNRLRGFEKGRVGPVDGKDHIGGNYAAAINFEAALPNLLPENTKTEVGLFLDFANVWGVDYDDTINDSNKIRSSLGASASWMSPLGPMTFVLSTNLSKADTDKTQSFSFNLGTSF
jgi:outer membrane protein insertion porin family